MQGHVQPERFRSFEVDYEFVLGRCLYRQVGWLLAPQDPIDISRCPTEWIDGIDAVCDKPAIGDKVAIGINRGQAVVQAEIDNALAMNRRVIVRGNQEAAVRIGSQSRQRGFDIPRLLYRGCDYLHRKSWRRLFD